MSGFKLDGFKQYSILFVEDEKDFVYIIKTFLSDIFAFVEVAYDGLEGKEKALARDFDIIITDITMPLLNGFEMAIEIKKIKPDQKIIALSAHKESEWLEKANEIGINAYLHKPVGVDELLEGLNKVLNQK